MGGAGDSLPHAGSATRRPERPGLSSPKTRYYWLGAFSRFVRRVAGRNRRVACATQYRIFNTLQANSHQPASPIDLHLLRLKIRSAHRSFRAKACVRQRSLPPLTRDLPFRVFGVFRGFHLLFRNSCQFASLSPVPIRVYPCPSVVKSPFHQFVAPGGFT